VALADAKQEDLYSMMLWSYDQIVGHPDQQPGNVHALPGSLNPTGSGWPQLGPNAQGANLTSLSRPTARSRSQPSLYDCPHPLVRCPRTCDYIERDGEH
jgi:hypothetical protein